MEIVIQIPVLILSNLRVCIFLFLHFRESKTHPIPCFIFIRWLKDTILKSTFLVSWWYEKILLHLDFTSRM